MIEREGKTQWDQVAVAFSHYLYNDFIDHGSHPASFASPRECTKDKEKWNWVSSCKWILRKRGWHPFEGWEHLLYSYSRWHCGYYYRKGQVKLRNYTTPHFKAVSWKQLPALGKFQRLVSPLNTWKMQWYDSVTSPLNLLVWLVEKSDGLWRWSHIIADLNRW